MSFLFLKILQNHNAQACVQSSIHKQRLHLNRVTSKPQCLFFVVVVFLFCFFFGGGGG